MLEPELAASGQAGPLLKVVADEGDVAAEWIWNHKAAIATGVGATMLLTNTAAVLNSGATVTTAAIDAVGTNVVRPFTEGIVWLFTRLAMLVAVIGAGTYALWLKAPELRGLHHPRPARLTGVSLFRAHRK